jgi:hypothetical protein
MENSCHEKKKGLAGSPKLCLPAASKTREETPGIEAERLQVEEIKPNH